MTQHQANPSSQAVLSPSALGRLRERYQRLKEQLLALGWIAQGSVMPQPPRAWRLTRKVKARTVSIGLSAEQADLYKEAIANHRTLEKILRQMREISERALQGSARGVKKRSLRKRP